MAITNIMTLKTCTHIWNHHSLKISVSTSIVSMTLVNLKRLCLLWRRALLGKQIQPFSQLKQFAVGNKYANKCLVLYICTSMLCQRHCINIKWDWVQAWCWLLSWDKLFCPQLINICLKHVWCCQAPLQPSLLMMSMLHCTPSCYVLDKPFICRLPFAWLRQNIVNQKISFKTSKLMLTWFWAWTSSQW